MNSSAAFDQNWLPPQGEEFMGSKQMYFDGMDPSEPFSDPFYIPAATTSATNSSSSSSSQQNTDDFLSQTLESLQELDFPLGDIQKPDEVLQQQQQPSNIIASNMLKQHKKQPSGTAIFGFMNHNKTLSINGISVAPSQLTKPQSQPVPQQPAPQQAQQQAPQQFQMVQQSVPVQLMSNPQPQNLMVQPMLFQNQQQMIDYSQQQQIPQHFPTQQVFQNNIYGQPPPPAPIMAKPMLYQIPTQQLPPQPQQQHTQHKPTPSEDFIITSNEPNQYKFPPENKYKSRKSASTSSSSSTLTSLSVQQHKLQQQHQQLLQQPSSEQDSKKTVTVPIEYLQKLTQYIKNREGIDLENFLNETEDINKLNFENPSKPQQQHPDSLSPLLKDDPSSTNANTPEEEPAENSNNSNSNGKSQDQLVGLGIKYNEPNDEQYINPNPPKTPSPVLASQPVFPQSEIIHTRHSESLQNHQCNHNHNLPHYQQFTPNHNNTYDQIRKPVTSVKKFNSEKPSTLPPGEIDSYILITNEKTFICNFNNCGKVFTRRYNARSHVQTHLSDRPYHCPEKGCDKAFVRHHDLTRHIKIHKEYIYKCPCGKEFSRQDTLYRHRIRKICSGGMDPDSSKTKASSSALTTPKSAVKSSVQKPSSVKRPSITLENDQVAKKLEFDVMNQHKMKQNQLQQHTKKKSHPNSSRNEIINIDDIKNNKVCFNTLDILQAPDLSSRDQSVSPSDQDSFLKDLNFQFDAGYN